MRPLSASSIVLAAILGASVVLLGAGTARAASVAPSRLAGERSTAVSAERPLAHAPCLQCFDACAAIDDWSDATDDDAAAEAARTPGRDPTRDGDDGARTATLRGLHAFSLPPIPALRL